MKKILVIEDDLFMRENSVEILELANFKVFSASDGIKGCKLAKELLPDLIISDVMMPSLDGYGVLHVLGKDPTTSSIPFIFLTAKAEKGDIRKGMELGADDYLTKPFEDTQLLNAVEIRLKKNDLIKKQVTRDIDGINNFIDRAKGLEQLQDLSSVRIPTNYKKNQVIFNNSDTPLYLYFIAKGKVKVFKTHDDGKVFVTNIFNEGDFFGIGPLFEDTNYSDTAVVLEDSQICKIEKKDFLTLVYKNRDVASQFIKVLSNNIEEKEKKLLSFAYDSVRKRAAHALVKLEQDYRREEIENTCITISRDDLAALAGTATETVVRCLSDFKSDNLIEVKGRQIKILDLTKLKNIRY